MISLIKDACRKIETFTEETGQPLDWVHSGSLKIARRPQDAGVIDEDFERGRRMRLDVELISPEQASRLNPFLRPTGIAAAMRIGDDRYFDPEQVAVGYARAAAANGVNLLPHTDVLAVNVSARKVTGVTTAKGTIEGPAVVDAAGAWTRQVAEASGIRVPLVPTRQQLIVTEPLEGAHSDLPMVRIMDAAVYMRPCQGGLLWGVYEEAPLFFDMPSLGPDFDVRDMPLDIGVLHSAAADVEDQLPILQTAPIREFRGGIPTMTADGHHILGPAPGSKASTLRVAATLPAFLSRRRWARRSRRGSSTASRPSISRRCLARASRTRRGPRLSCGAMPPNNIGTSTARFDLSRTCLGIARVIELLIGCVPITELSPIFARGQRVSSGDCAREPAGSTNRSTCTQPDSR